MPEDHGTFGALLHYPHLWLAVLANFCNVGAQVSSWSSLIPYMKQYTNGQREDRGSLLDGFAGRDDGRPICDYAVDEIFPADHVAGLYGAMNVFLIGAGDHAARDVGAYAIVASSFFLSIMFPTIFALGLKRLGPNTKLASSLLVMAIVGGAIFPPILGWIARRTGSIAVGYFVPAFGYAGVSLYGFLARRVRPERSCGGTARILDR